MLDKISNREDRRIERLRNFLTPLFLLPDLLEKDADPEMIIELVRDIQEISKPKIMKCLDYDATLEDLEALDNE